MKSPLEQLQEASVPPPNPSTMDDLLRSIRSVLEYNAETADIVLGVPEDNEEVMAALAKAGGEIRITIRAAPRPILELLASHSVGTPMDNPPDPSLPGMSFGGHE